MEGEEICYRRVKKVMVCRYDELPANVMIEAQYVTKPTDDFICKAETYVEVSVLEERNESLENHTILR